MRQSRLAVLRSGLGPLSICVTPICLAIALAGCSASPAAEWAAPASTTGSAGTARTETGSNALLPQLLRSPSARSDEAFEAYSPLHSTRRPSLLPVGPQPWSRAEEDAIIAIAITAHEMRRP
jgi:hypothetical protein